MVQDAVPDRVSVKKEPHLQDYPGGGILDMSSRGDVGVLAHDGHHNLLIDVTVRTPTMCWEDTGSFLEKAEREKEHRYYNWLNTLGSSTSVFYAASSVHGRWGADFEKMLSFCARMRSDRACSLEAASVKAIFRQVWEARLLLTTARAVFRHAQRAVHKLLTQDPPVSAKQIFIRRSSTDPSYVAGVGFLRSAEPSQMGGEGDLFH